MKTRILSISLLFVLLAPALIIGSWLNYQKSVVRHNVKWKMAEGMDKNKLTLLKFTKEESVTNLRWKHAKEFEYKGEMYDVVVKEVVEDTIHYWCWWDHEETKLNKQLAQLVNEALTTNPQKKEKEERLISFYKSMFWADIFSCDLTALIPESQSESFHLISFSAISFSPSTPPPKSV